MKEQMFFTNQDEFLAHIEKIESVTDPWFKTPIVELSKIIRLSDDNKSLEIDTPTGKHKLRDVSLRSLRQRLGIEFPMGTFVLSSSKESETYAGLSMKLVSWACDALEAKGLKNTDIAKISVVDGEANAFLSKEYVEYVNSRYVHNSAFEKIMSATGETNFGFKGWFDYTMSNAEYETSKVSKVNGKDYNTVIRVRTSDSGYSSIAIGVLLKCAGKYLPMMTDIEIPHRSGKTKSEEEVKKKFIFNLDEALTQADKVINEAIPKAEALTKIELKYPKDAAMHIAKDVGLPKAETLKAVEAISGNTAWDIYTGLCEIIQDDWTIEKRIKQTGNLTKMLGINWNKYDSAFKW